MKRLLIAMEREASGERGALVPTDLFVAGVQLFFPAKSPEHLNELTQAALQHSQTDGHIDIAKILFETDDGAQSPFMEKARSQMMSVQLF